VHGTAIATWSFGRLAIEAGGPILARGGTALDAVERGINAVELDPAVASVAYGGRPNAEGVVELDAMIMEGASCRAGAVGALRGVATPISVARRLMEAGPHTFLVGEGALAFAQAQGFETRDLLTEDSRERFEQWRAEPSRREAPHHDTVGMVAVDAAGHVAAGCSTSGFPYKLPGRVGDSPIIGAGAWCDDDVGGAAATGDGDVMLRFCLAFAAVQAMRAGLAPAEACAQALEPMRARDGRAEAALVALARDGSTGAAVIGRGSFPHVTWERGRAEGRSVPALEAAP
jgi:L-asparaginase/N4-(beta-N-acetylglucosaminyl)-L-asparaginase